MRNRLYKFLNNNNIFYLLQFGFWQKYSASLLLIHLTESIKETLDQGKYGCGIADLQKAFNTVDHNIVMGKLKHYSIRGEAYSRIESYLKRRKQYVSINGFNSLLWNSTSFCSWTIIISSLHQWFAYCYQILQGSSFCWWH